MSLKALYGMAAFALLVACGDDTGSGTAGAPSSGGGGNGSGGGPTGGGGNGTGGAGGASVDCPSVCDTIYTCGLAMEDGAQHCPAFADTARARADLVDACIVACEENPAFTAGVSASNCAQTIDTLVALDQGDFANACCGGDEACLGGGQGGGGTGGGSGECITCFTAFLDPTSTQGASFCEGSGALYDAWVACVCTPGSATCGDGNECASDACPPAWPPSAPKCGNCVAQNCDAAYGDCTADM